YRAHVEPAPASRKGSVIGDAIVATAYAKAGDRRGGQRREQLEEAVVRVEHRGPVSREPGHELALRPRQMVLRLEELHVHDADVRDDADLRTGQGHETCDIACTLKAHLEDESGVIRLQAEDGRRNAGFGVEV